MDKQPDETDKPEPSLFDAIPDAVPQAPVEQPAMAAAPADAPAAHPIPAPAETPAADPVPAPAAPTHLADEPPATASLATPADPHDLAQPDDLTPITPMAAPVEFVHEPAPATAHEVPLAIDESALPDHAADDADVAASSARDAFDLAAALPAESLPLEPSSDTDLSSPEPADVPAEVTPIPPMPPAGKPEPSTGAWWTIPMICVGLMMVACALIVGQVEINRQVAWQRNKLKIDLDYLHEQVKQNDEFLKRIQTDPTMAERLAQRQMKQVREGSAILDVRGLPHQNDRNPFQLTMIPPPQPLAPYRPRGDLLTTLFVDPDGLGPHRQREQRALVAIGLGLMLVAAGLVLGGPDEPAELDEQQKAPKAPPMAR